MSIYNSIDLTLRPIYKKANRRQEKIAKKNLKKLNIRKEKIKAAVDSPSAPKFIIRKKDQAV